MMKWLYRILRLWVCPHKYVYWSKVTLSEDGDVYGHLILLQCKHCGKLKKVRT